MKNFSKAMLFAMFLLGACSTAGDTDVEKSSCDLADYGYRVLYDNDGIVEEKYIALGDEPYYYMGEDGFGPFQVIEATTTYLEIHFGETTIYTYSKSADETVPDEIVMSGTSADVTYEHPVPTKYLGD